MNIDHIRLEDYSYDLPEEYIAQKPLPNRDESKMLVYRSGTIKHTHFNNLKNELKEEDLLILNNAKVLPARMHFFRQSGARIEIFLLEPIKPYLQMERALSSTSPVEWKCLIGNLKKWKSNEILSAELMDGKETFKIFAELVSYDDQIVRIRWDHPTDFTRVLETGGKTPLPPYIKRDAEKKDENSYQTVFATESGAVAAPTAGLHFSRDLLAELKNKKIQFSEITLFVGAGTFAPVTVEYMKDHSMHREVFTVRLETIQQLKKSNRRIAVGTTSIRTLESLYWIGTKIRNRLNDPLNIEALFPYSQSGPELNWEEALESIENHLILKKSDTLRASTALMILPGYEFRSAEGLITNFHSPKTTLIMLVAAFIGKDWRSVYNEALKNNYRFLSYGDSSLLWRNQS
ncbi:MAG: S-adenosylmethionine:tRNA ribosyltransferase-isomerase [Flavobacteriales bacterium]|nr:S-adenosylmethionine:tRNA ribosyltransferase-isomerase [Flavobacteriales bacterium]